MSQLNRGVKPRSRERADKVIWQDYYGEAQLRFFQHETKFIAVLDDLNKIRHYRSVENYDSYLENLKSKVYAVSLENAIL